MTRGFLDERHDTDPVTIEDVKAVAVSPSGAGLLVEIDGKQRWLPQSHITDDSEVFEPGQRGKLVITAWLARKEGLLDE